MKKLNLGPGLIVKINYINQFPELDLQSFKEKIPFRTLIKNVEKLNKEVLALIRKIGIV